jgi:L-lactate dehydrogenase complex protein LldG
MDRDAFLDQIAARLGRARQQRPPPRTAIGVPDFYRKSRVAEARPALLQAFERELSAVGGGVRLVRSVADASVALRAELAHFQATRVVSSARSEFSRFDFGWLWHELGARAVLDDGMRNEAEQRSALAGAQASVTTVDCAIANTGSLLVTAAATRPRSLSLLPGVHIAVLFASQIVSHLGPAFDLLGASDSLPSGAHVITGPSRTSDIENDLTIGVHGPSAVTAIVVTEESA